jgi:hypothetical protein
LYMTDRFLKAKHWQLFLLMVGIPMVLQFVLMGQLVVGFAFQSHPDLVIMLGYMKYFPILAILCISVLFGWFWSVAVGLQNKVPVNIRMKVKKFKVFFIFPLVYMVAFLTFFSVIMSSPAANNPEPSEGLIGGLFAVVVPLYLFAIFCFLYTFYFVAKTLKTVEMQREVKFGNFAGEFFLLWFYPVGVWILQPKINKMIEE